jgi:hypothetical protein
MKPGQSNPQGEKRAMRKRAMRNALYIKVKPTHAQPLLFKVIYPPL